MQLLRLPGKVHFILDLIESAEALSVALLDRAETICSEIVMMEIQTAHEMVRADAEKAAHQLGRLFTDSIASGRISKNGIFDRHDKPTPGTDPQAHTSASDCATDDVPTLLQEAAVNAMSGQTYAGAIDDIGCFCSHYGKFSKLLTGNCDADLVKNR